VKSWVLAYTLSLSKRTTLYTGYLHNDNESETRQTILASNRIDGVTVRGEDSDNFVVGVRHTSEPADGHHIERDASAPVFISRATPRR